MRPWAGRCPSSSLPPLHPLQLGRPINLHHAIDFPIGMAVILAGKLLLRAHVHGGDAEEARVRPRESDLGAAVVGPVDLDVGDPAFVQPFDGERAQVVVDGVPGPVVLVEEELELFSRRSA